MSEYTEKVYMKTAGLNPKLCFTTLIMNQHSGWEGEFLNWLTIKVLRINYIHITLVWISVIHISYGVKERSMK